jgi:hypothetical protein
MIKIPTWTVLVFAFLLAYLFLLTRLHIKAAELRGQIDCMSWALGVETEK